MPYCTSNFAITGLSLKLTPPINCVYHHYLDKNYIFSWQLKNCLPLYSCNDSVPLVEIISDNVSVNFQTKYFHVSQSVFSNFKSKCHDKFVFLTVLL